MKSYLIFVPFAALALVSGCKTDASGEAGQAPPSGNPYGNPPGYAGRGSYPADSDYVEVTPAPPAGGGRGGAYQPPAYESSGGGASASGGGGSYTVQKGDTLYGISRKNSTSVSALKSTNNLTSDTIKPGQVLRIP